MIRGDETSRIDSKGPRIALQAFLGLGGTVTGVGPGWSVMAL